MSVKKTTILRNIDPDIWREFKTLCAKSDISMNKKIKELISKCVKTEGNKV